MDDTTEVQATDSTVMDRVFGDSPEATPAETPAVEAAETKSPEPTVSGDEVKPEPTPEPKAEPEKEVAAKTEAEKPKVEAKAEPESKNWDTDDNPHKQRAEDLAKREKAARDWATQINQQYMAQKRELEIINKKLDGTYDPQVDEPRIDPEQVLKHARAQGAVQASIAAVVDKLGDVKTRAELDRFNQLFDANESIQHRVLNAASPMAEAIKVLNEWDITQKYGSTDVNVLVEKIKAEAVAEMRETIRKEEHQKIMDGIAMKNKTPNGVREMRQAGGDTKPAGPRPLSSFFNN